MGHDGGVAGAVGHLDGVQGLGQGADLVDLDEDGVGHALGDAVGQTGHVGDEQVVANQLDLGADGLGQHGPALPVVLGHAVLEGDDGIGVGELLPHIDQLLLGHLLAGLGLDVALLLVVPPLGGSGVDGDHEVLAGLEAGLLDGLHDDLQGVLILLQVGGVAALVAHAGGGSAVVLQGLLQLIAIDKMDIPQGVSIQLSGSYEDQQDSFRDLLTLAVLIIILVYIVMAAQFESYTYPGIIMTSLLFAFSGVFIILWLSGHTLNVMSMIGAIMLIGIVVKNGIVLIDYISLNRERGMSVRTAVILGGESRLRPVVMTTLTTILGMVPMAVGTGQGAEMWRPMGTAVIGGLTVSTILTLLFVPMLYCVFAGRDIQKARRKFHRQLKAAKK